MSRHLTSNPLANSGELDQLRRQLGMHVKAPESTRSAMAAMHANAQKKDAEQANRDKAIELGIIEPEPMSQYTDEDIDVYLAQGERADELDAQIDAEQVANEIANHGSAEPLDEQTCPHADCGFGECSGRWMGTACETHFNSEGRCQKKGA